MTYSALSVLLLLESCSKDELEAEVVQADLKNSTSSSAIQTSTAPAFTQLFETFGGGWTGGDGAYSIPLPDGRILWTFGDSFLGTVNPDFSRPGGPLINNTFVIQDGNQLETLYGGTPSNPEAYVRPWDSSTDFYWPGDGTVIGDRLYMFMLRIRLTGEGGPFGFEHIGTDLAVFSLPDLQLIHQREIARTTEYLMGVSIYEEEDWIYVYGTYSSFGKDALVARVSVNDLDLIQHWNGDGWQSGFDGDAFMLTEDGSNLKVSNMFSVFRYDGKYRLLTQQDFFSNRIMLYSSDSPTGPWRNPVLVYETPETGDDVFTYNASCHPHIIHPEKGMLVTYSVNSFDFWDLFEDARLYRPRFFWMKAAGD